MNWTFRLHPRLRRPYGKAASLTFTTWENGCLRSSSPSRQRLLFSSAFLNRTTCSGSSGRLLFGLAIVLVLWIQLDRIRRKYAVTDRRVSCEYGIINKNSNEVRVQDVRSINLRKTGISGVLGIGTVEFSSAATDDADVTFWNIPEAEKIRDLVQISAELAPRLLQRTGERKEGSGAHYMQRTAQFYLIIVGLAAPWPLPDFTRRGSYLRTGFAIPNVSRDCYGPVRTPGITPTEGHSFRHALTGKRGGPAQSIFPSTLRRHHCFVLLRLAFDSLRTASRRR